MLETVTADQLVVGDVITEDEVGPRYPVTAITARHFTIDGDPDGTPLPLRFARSSRKTVLRVAS